MKTIAAIELERLQELLDDPRFASLDERSIARLVGQPAGGKHERIAPDPVGWAVPTLDPGVRAVPTTDPGVRRAVPAGPTGSVGVPPALQSLPGPTDLWFAFLNEALGPSRAPSSERGRSRSERKEPLPHGRGSAGHEFDSDAWQAVEFAAEYLWTRLAAQLNGELREDFQHDGRAYVAVQYLLARQTLDGIEQLEDQSSEIAGAILQLKGICTQLETDNEGLSNQLSDVLRELSEQRQYLVAGFENTQVIRDRIEDGSLARDAGVAAADEIQRRGLIQPTAPPTTNLSGDIAPINDAFIGRAADLSRLDDALRNPAAHTIAVVAGAGFGKTELVKHYLHTWAAPGAGPPGAADSPGAAAWDGRWWLDASKIGEQPAADALYQTLYGQPPPKDSDLPAVRAAIVQRLSHGRHLLVLDNAETPEQIRAWKLPGRGRVVATTRRQPIPPATARTIELDVLEPADALALLKSGRPGTVWTAADEAALAEVAGHLGRHALALAFAAARLATPPYLAPAALLEGLKRADVGEERHILEEVAADDLGAGYKLGLARSLALLLDPLDDPLALRALAIAAFCHPDAIPLEIFYAALDEPNGEIDRGLLALHQRSLIQLSTTASLHRLTQSLVRGRLRRTGQWESTLERLLDALIQIINDVDYAGFHLRTAVWPDADDAIAHAESSAAPPSFAARAARLRAGLAFHLALAGQLAPAAAHIEASIRWGESQTQRDERSLAIRYASRASIRQARGDLAGAEADIARSIAWGESQTPRDERGLAILYASRASIRQDRGDLAGAEADIARSIAWGESQTPRDERGLAIRYASRASIRQARGDLAGAEADIARSIAWGESQTPRDERSLAIWYASRASIRQARGDLAGAEADIARSIAWGESQTPRDERGLSIWHADRARIRRDQLIEAFKAGDVAQAARRLSEARADYELAIARHERALGPDAPVATYMHAELADVLAMLAEPAAAAEHARTAVRLGRAWFGEGHPKVEKLERRAAELERQAREPGGGA